MLSFLSSIIDINLIKCLSFFGPCCKQTFILEKLFCSYSRSRLLLSPFVGADVLWPYSMPIGWYLIKTDPSGLGSCLCLKIWHAHSTQCGASTTRLRPNILASNASLYDLGAVLSQVSANEEIARPFTFASKSFSCSQANHPAHRLKFLATKWELCGKFSHWFKVHRFTDWSNNPLTYIFTKPKINTCEQHWVSELAPYSFWDQTCSQYSVAPHTHTSSGLPAFLLSWYGEGWPRPCKELP